MVDLVFLNLYEVIMPFWFMQVEAVGMSQHMLGTLEKECLQRLSAEMSLLLHLLIPSWL